MLEGVGLTLLTTLMMVQVVGEGVGIFLAVGVVVVRIVVAMMVELEELHQLL